MSLQIAAQNMASKGRGPDSQLVHMSPREVKGLQALAMAGGGSLSINPQTGLPEAGFLDRMLPMLIGAGITAATGGAATPLMVGLGVGGFEAARTGSLQKGLMAGIGAYGGAGIGAGLTEAGLAEAAVPGAAPVSAAAPTSFPTDAAAYEGLGATGSQYGVMGESLPQVGAPIPDVNIAATPTTPLGYESFNPTPTQYGAMGEPPVVAPTAQITPQVVAPAAQITPQVAAPGTYSPTAQTAPGFGTESAQKAARERLASMSPTERLGQAGRGISGMMDNQATRDAFMNKVGGGTGLLKTGAMAAAPLLASLGQNEEKYKGSGPNPYEYSYDYRTGSYTRQAPGYRGAQSVTPPRLMAMGGLTALARGGQSHLGDYSDGGRMLRGPGDGVSDSIPATIGGKRPARLADGEFVVPSRIVSEIGNGSSEAGARKLYAMMNRVQRARKKSIGRNKVAVDSRADKMLPA
jgi:hypothetical protein